VQLNYFLATQILEEGSERGQLTGNRSLLALFAIESRQIFADRNMIDLVYVDFGTVPGFVERAQVVIKLLEVAQIVPDRVGRNVPLILQVFGEPVDILLHGTTRAWRRGLKTGSVNILHRIAIRSSRWHRSRSNKKLYFFIRSLVGTVFRGRKRTPGLLSLL